MSLQYKGKNLYYETRLGCIFPLTDKNFALLASAEISGGFKGTMDTSLGNNTAALDTDSPF